MIDKSTQGLSRNETNRHMNNAIRRVVVSDEDLYYFFLINSWGPGQGVCIFGIITNVLNIITFVRQGIRDTVNISLLGLATSDLWSQITLFYANLNVIPAFVALDLPFVAADIVYINGLCHVIFTRVSAWITAYITLERCLCVTLPLKVKNIFTPNRTVLYLNLMYIIMFASVFPCFYTMRPATVFDPLRNRTILRILYIEGREIIENITFVTNNAIPSIALFLIVICTSILVVNLRQKSKWRIKVTSASSNNSVAMSNRDSKAVKMVVLIAAIFIVCYVPSMIAFLYILLDPDTRIDGYQRNLCFSLFALFFHLESINAGVNTFVYYNMSSKFKSTLKSMFTVNRRKGTIILTYPKRKESLEIPDC